VYNKSFDDVIDKVHGHFLLVLLVTLLLLSKFIVILFAFSCLPGFVHFLVSQKKLPANLTSDYSSHRPSKPSCSRPPTIVNPPSVYVNQSPAELLQLDQEHIILHVDVQVYLRLNNLSVITAPSDGHCLIHFWTISADLSPSTVHDATRCSQDPSLRSGSCSASCPGDRRVIASFVISLLSLSSHLRFQEFLICALHRAQIVRKRYFVWHHDDVIELWRIHGIHH
jgi:hypothetical protein